MTSISRRSFLAASVAAASTPALATPVSAQTREADVVIVGAGAAGIAAARRIIAAGRRPLVLEASARIGGRCVTDTRLFGVPFDLGAHWLHMPDINPVAKLKPRGFDVYPAPVGQRIRIGRRNAREGELEDYLSATVRANRAIQEAARGKADVSCAQALPKDLGDWRPTVDFTLGPFGCAKDLSEISAVDFARSAERDVDAFCRQGLGAMLARLADGIPVQLSTPVTRIDWGGTQLAVETDKGRIVARQVIVTASTNVLLAGKIRFTPELPKRHAEALGRLRLGSYDHVAVEMTGNPLGLQADELVFEKADNNRTAALLANVSDTPLAMIEVGGRFGRELSGKGPAAMVDFAGEWLAKLYGNDIRRNIGRSHATRWNEEPWALGAFSAAAVGGQGARRILMEPLRDRVAFAGEAAHETMWGTVGGAWESGERAAEAALRRIGALRDTNEPAASSKKPPPRRQPARHQP